MKKILFTVFTCSLLADEPFFYDPFNQIMQQNISVDENGSLIEEKPIIASAYFSGRVFINGSWYAKGDEFNGKSIISIKPNSVKIKDKDEIVEISIGTKSNAILKIKDKK